MFLNQTQPRSLLSEIKEYISEGVKTVQNFAPSIDLSAVTEVNLNAVAANENRVREIEHKRTMVGLGLSDWR